MKPAVYVISLLVLSIMLSAYAVALVFKDIPVGETLNGVWAFEFAIFVALWAKADAGVQKVHRTLDFSAYFFMAWALALPYYLVKTRGVKGVVYFCGFAFLYVAPFIFSLLAYAYVYAE